MFYSHPSSKERPQRSRAAGGGQGFVYIFMLIEDRLEGKSAEVLDMKQRRIKVITNKGGSVRDYKLTPFLECYQILILRNVASGTYKKLATNWV